MSRPTSEHSKKRARLAESDDDVEPTAKRPTSLADEAAREEEPLEFDDFMPTIATGPSEAEIAESKAQAIAASGRTFVDPMKREDSISRILNSSKNGSRLKKNNIALTNPLGIPYAPARVSLPSVSPSSRRTSTSSTHERLDPIMSYYDESSQPTDSGANNYMAPQVKIGPDGQITFDTSSLAIQQIQEPEDGPRTVVHGHKRHITSATYQKRIHSLKWTEFEIDRFYLALRKCGTDFSMMEMFFPNRTRTHIRNRYKKEEQDNPEKVEHALRNRLPISDGEFDQLVAEKAGLSPPSVSD